MIWMPFLSFKRITHVYLLKISITHNKKRIPLLNLLINCISEKSAPQILSIKGDCTFLFLNFLIIGLCYYSANYWFEIFSFSIPLPVKLFTSIAEVFFIKGFIDHWSKSTLISIIFWISSNIKCFMMQYVIIRSCFSSLILEISIGHAMLKTSLT